MGLVPKGEDGTILFKTVDFVDTWKAMEACVRQGLVRSIGISNFNSQQISRLMSHCSIKPVTNQVCASVKIEFSDENEESGFVIFRSKSMPT